MRVVIRSLLSVDSSIQSNAPASAQTVEYVDEIAQLVDNAARVGWIDLMTSKPESNTPHANSTCVDAVPDIIERY